MDLPITLSSLRVLAHAAANVAPGDWWTDKEANDADPKYDVPVLFAGDKRLLDAHSSDIVLLREDFTGDEGGEWREIWDDNSAVLFAFLQAANPSTILALDAHVGTIERHARALEGALRDLLAAYDAVDPAGNPYPLEHPTWDAPIDNARSTLAGFAPSNTPAALFPMARAKKDGRPISAKMTTKPGVLPERCQYLAGLWFTVRHGGVLEDGFDLGWQYPGHGGLPDHWFDGWWPLPSGDADYETRVAARVDPNAQSAPT